MKEVFLQYVWQHRLYLGDLRTSDGSPVVVDYPGEPNRHAGPDFLNARLRIGGVLWAGNVEVHVDASDWVAHHHETDDNYNNVVLHVVFRGDLPARLHNGRLVPTLCLEPYVPSEVLAAYESLVHSSPDTDVACLSSAAALPSLTIQQCLDRYVVERLERKSDDVQRLLTDSMGSWETCCYQMVARYFGGQANGFAFELLAKMTPLSLVAKVRDSRFRVEALLMGQAGLLQADFHDEYPNRLRREYEYMQKAYTLHPMASHLWRFARMRPVGFPTIRISQLSHLLSQPHHLFAALRDTDSLDTLRSLFCLSASDYWNDHYTFDKPSRPCHKTTGTMFADLLIINAWAPLLFQYGVQHGDQASKDRAVELLRRLPPETNHIVTLFHPLVSPDNAAQSQALVQMYNEHCSQRDCLQCPICYGVLRGRRRASSRHASSTPTSREKQPLTS